MLVHPPLPPPPPYTVAVSTTTRPRRNELLSPPARLCYPVRSSLAPSPPPSPLPPCGPESWLSRSFYDHGRCHRRRLSWKGTWGLCAVPCHVVLCRTSLYRITHCGRSQSAARGVVMMWTWHVAAKTDLRHCKPDRLDGSSCCRDSMCCRVWLTMEPTTLHTLAPARIWWQH